MSRLSLSALLCVLSIGSAVAEYSVGSVPPDFTCATTRPDLHGSSWNLYSQRGKVVMINFGATWCGPCNSEFPYLESHYEQHFDPEGFELVHVDVDNASATTLNNWWQQYGITFPLLMGCASLFGSYGTGYIPHTLIIDPQGIVRGNWVGFSTGDIPVLQSIIETYLVIPHPVLNISQQVFSGDANGDGRADPGETINLALQLHNSGNALEALGTTASLSCLHPGITMVSNSSTYPALPAGQSGYGDLEFSFSVAPDAPVSWADFTLTLSSSHSGSGTPWITELTFPVRIGRPERLIVDSDGAQDDNENWALAAYSQRGLEVDLWGAGQGEIGATELARYPRVLWLGGVDQADVSITEAAALASYVEGGGKLLLSSQYALDNPQNAQFFAETFRVALNQNLTSSSIILAGATPDGPFGGTNLVITGSGGAANNQAPDRLTVLPGGTACLNWTQSGGGTGGVYTEEGSRAMFLGFPLEASRYYASYPASLTMAQFLEQADAWFDYTDPVTTAPIEVHFSLDLGCLDDWTYAGGVSLSGTGPTLGEGQPGSISMTESQEPGQFEASVVFPVGVTLAQEYRFAISADGLVWNEESLPQARPLTLMNDVPVLPLPIANWNDQLCRPEVRIQLFGGAVVFLEWDAVPGATLYRVHGAADPWFTPSPSNLLSQQPALSLGMLLSPELRFFTVIAVRQEE